MSGQEVILYGEGVKEGPSGGPGRGRRSDSVRGTVVWAEAKTTCRGEGSRFHSKIISPHSSSPNLNEQNFLVQQGKHQVCVREPTLSFTIVGKGFELEGSSPGPCRKGSGE